MKICLCSIYSIKMLAISLLLQGCIASFQIWSPDELASLVVTPSIAKYGDGFLLPRFGKLFLVKYSNSCSFTTQMPENSFAILYNFYGCYFQDLSLSVQNSGGIAMIFVLSTDKTNFIMTAYDPPAAAAISILSLCISNSVGKKIQAYSTKEIWATYSYTFPQGPSAHIYFEMSSNYTLDSPYISAFQSISTAVSLPLSDFSMVFCYVPLSTSGLLATDCVSASSYSYCLPHTSTVTGSQMINNSVNILNYYSIYTGTLSSFLSLLLNLYQTCADDYSTACLQGVFTGVSLSDSLTVLSNSVDWGNIAPFYYINSTYFLWEIGIWDAYCLSLDPPSSSCPVCASGCSYSDLDSTSCNSACNVTACGYERLTCLGGSGCYSFMLGDGNCNANCVGDQDCVSNVCETGCLYSDMQVGLCPVACSGACFLNCSSSYCSPECTFSEMSNGLCPVECTSACFANCSSAFCSPGCLYSDLNSGICSSNCTNACLAKCNTDCSPGCSFSDMKEGYCPLNCSQSNCFEHCSSSYCSPACLFSDLAVGNCSDQCTLPCMQKCNVSHICPGCTYSNMQAGNCPVNCTGTCFNYCSSDYCSPGCSYTDLSRGICDSSCTSSCLNQCNTSNVCSNGCYYSDMAQGECSINCIGNCFNYCSDNYCSPGCLKSDINDTYCPDVCSSGCCAMKRGGSTLLLVIIILPPLIGIFM